MSNAIVLMSAIVPTIGHKILIDFASNVVERTGGNVYVIICSLSKEPTFGSDRFIAFKQTYKHNPKVHIFHYWKDAPQEPHEHRRFWEVWRDIVLDFVDVKSDDYFIASEKYGMDMANILGCKFLPCNRYREIIPISGTEVRKDLLGKFGYILPEFQYIIRPKVTIFGPESCGKTTMAKRLAKEGDEWLVRSRMGSRIS